MGVIKRVLCRERLRRIPPHFNWVDHRLVRDSRQRRLPAWIPPRQISTLPPVRVQQPGSGKTQTARFWIYTGDDTHPHVVFDYTVSRSR
ncbi:MAG: hypothetical protein ABSE73_00150, partial [Planctomycetota bacterium]